MVNKGSKEEIRNKILKYISKVYSDENRFVSKREIRKKFRIGLYNYFENIFEMYKQIGIEVPLAYCPKEYARNKIVDFVKKEYGKGRFVGRLDLEISFNVSIYTYFTSMDPLYQTAGIYLKEYQNNLRERSNPFNSKEENIQSKNLIKKIIRENVSNGIYPSVHFI